MRGGSIDGEPIYGDMVCATCFTVIAEAKGIASRWRLQPDVLNVALETVTPSGRTWDSDRWLWADPAGR
ncbi:MAG: hypothetical protein QOH47_790 [Sphingomonadales bacterium]|jgi:hypothetical protein|nr:hypothetical protein [Sphingomonadales bacterium]